MKIGVSDNLPLKYFPYIDATVNPEGVNKKFLLKCNDLSEQNAEIVLSNETEEADIVFSCKGHEKHRKSIFFSANREDLIDYTSLYDEIFDIYPVDSLGFQPVDFIIDDDFCWVVFTSKRAVDFFLQRVNARFFCSKKIAAIGAKTAERLNGYGFKMDYIPSDFYAEALIEFLKDKERVLVIAPVKYNRAFDELKNIKVIPVYENIIPKTIAYYDHKDRQFDFGLFTSPSAFWHIKEFFGGFEFAENIQRIIAIGNTTKRYIESCGFEAEIPAQPTIKDMFDYVIKKG